MFDCMGALSTKRNNDPTKASRAFDKDRDGFVIAGTQRERERVIAGTQFTCFTVLYALAPCIPDRYEAFS